MCRRRAKPPVFGVFHGKMGCFVVGTGANAPTAILYDVGHVVRPSARAVCGRVPFNWGLMTHTDQPKEQQKRIVGPSSRILPSPSATPLSVIPLQSKYPNPSAGPFRSFFILTTSTLQRLLWPLYPDPDTCCCCGRLV